MSTATDFKTSVESRLRHGDLPAGVTDRDVDGPDEGPRSLPDPTQDQIDQFCAEDLRDIFSECWSDMGNRHHAEAFGRKAAEAWEKYADRHGIRKD